ncbi:hypothetical protein FBU30_001587 [Linnemannia zychae]|nr:hypothetical protein FBU30_001587 [Linnemannia zychae]
MPTKRTFSFVFRGKQIEVEREYPSDEEDLINTKPRCLWPDDGRDYNAKEDQEYEQHDEQADASVAQPHNEYSQDGWELQDGPDTSLYSSPHNDAQDYDTYADNDDYEGNVLADDENDPYPDEEYGDNSYADDEYEESLPPQPTIHRGYTAESVTMVRHSSHIKGTRQKDVDNNEDEDQDDEQDRTMYTVLDADSGDEHSSHVYSRENLDNPFKYIPNQERDWLDAQERERQRIECRNKLGIVGRGIKYPIPAELLEAPSPTTTFGRTTLWPMRVELPLVPASRPLPYAPMLIRNRPNFSIGPAFKQPIFTPAPIPATEPASASTSTSVPSTRSRHHLVQKSLTPKEAKEKAVATSTTVTTRPARPDEIQAIYAAILGRRKPPPTEQEEQPIYQSEDLDSRQLILTGGNGSSLYGSEEEQELEEKTEVSEENDADATLTTEQLYQKKLEDLGPCHPGHKRHHCSTDECEAEDIMENENENDKTTDSIGELSSEVILHECFVFDGWCWSQGKRDLVIGIYWRETNERKLSSLYRRIDKFRVMDRRDTVRSSWSQWENFPSQQSISHPSTPLFSLSVDTVSSGYFSS